MRMYMPQLSAASKLNVLKLYGPRQANLVLIAYASSKVQASLRICAVSPEPPLLAYTDSESRGTFRQKARSLAPLNGWVCAVKICHDGMLEDTNSLDGAHILLVLSLLLACFLYTCTVMILSFRTDRGAVWSGSPPFAIQSASFRSITVW